MRKLKVLHIAQDDKFFDGVFNAFESDERFENSAVLQVKDVKSYNYIMIKNTSVIRLVNRLGMKSILREGNYDIIFFYSLRLRQYEYSKWIPTNKIVIWWSWGMDLYPSSSAVTPLIPIDTLLPQTSSFLQELRGPVPVFKTFVKNNILRLLNDYKRYRIIRKVDYFQPVIPEEYPLVKRAFGFHAKEFYFPRCFTGYHVETNMQRSADGNILIGNSQAPTNNHIDVWNSCRQYIPCNREIFFPINYERNMDYADALTQYIYSDKHHITFLRNFMPRNEYFRLIDGCSYAIFGVLRQQAMGNIYFCLSHGIKVFLYRDSIVYRSLKEGGFVVFAIEDIDENSFNIPLSHEDLVQMAYAFEKRKQYIDKVREKAIADIKQSVDNY